MSTVLQSIHDLTPTWLTATLQRGGVLPSGEVTHIEATRTLHMASLNTFLSVAYSPAAPSDAPTRLFLKLSRPERLPLTASEVEYYTRITTAMPHPATPRCYDAQFEPSNGSYHILLEDVSATHGMVEFPLPPKRPQADLMVDTLARLHSFWWEHPQLAEYAHLPTPQVMERYVSYCEGGLGKLIDFMGDRLAPHHRRIVEQVFEKHRHLMIARAAHNQHLTLIHGDSHAGNFLLPLNGGHAYLIDRQPFDWSLTCWLGVSDLTYMIVHWWYPERRRALQIPLLRRYLHHLEQSGIQGYGWEQLWQDYRLCAMQSFYVAVEWCRDDPPHEKAWLWYPQLQNTLAAFEDLECQELLS